MSEPSLRFVLEGSGWARVEFSNEHADFVVSSLSYLSNALDDLLRAGIDIAIGRHYGLAQFFHEPGSTVLAAETGWWADEEWVVGARLSTYQGGEYGEPEPTWCEAHAAIRQNVVLLPSENDLLLLILGSGYEVLKRYGVDGYANFWGGTRGFPFEALRALEAAMEKR